MKSPDELRTDWRTRWRSYLATVGILALLALVIALLLAWRPDAGPPKPSTAPVGFSAEWRCNGASPKGGGFCWRELPPAAKPSPRPMPQDRTRP